MCRVTLACCRFRGHRDWVFHEAGGAAGRGRPSCLYHRAECARSSVHRDTAEPALDRRLHLRLDGRGPALCGRRDRPVLAAGPPGVPTSMRRTARPSRRSVIFRASLAQRRSMATQVTRSRRRCSPSVSARRATRAVEVDKRVARLQSELPSEEAARSSTTQNPSGQSESSQPPRLRSMNQNPDMLGIWRLL